MTVEALPGGLGGGVLTHPGRVEPYVAPAYPLSLAVLVAWLETMYGSYSLVRVVESAEAGTTELWEADVDVTLCYAAVDGGVIVRPRGWVGAGRPVQRGRGHR